MPSSRENTNSDSGARSQMSGQEIDEEGRDGRVVRRLALVLVSSTYLIPPGTSSRVPTMRTSRLTRFTYWRFKPDELAQSATEIHGGIHQHSKVRVGGFDELLDLSAVRYAAPFRNRGSVTFRQGDSVIRRASAASFMTLSQDPVALLDRAGMKALVDEVPDPRLDEELVDPGESDVAEGRHHVVAEIALVASPRRRAKVDLRLEPLVGPIAEQELAKLRVDVGAALHLDLDAVGELLGVGLALERSSSADGRRGRATGPDSRCAIA